MIKCILCFVGAMAQSLQGAAPAQVPQCGPCNRAVSRCGGKIGYGILFGT